MLFFKSINKCLYKWWASIVVIILILIGIIVIYNTISGNKGTWSENFIIPSEDTFKLSFDNDYKPNKKYYESYNISSKGEYECKRVLENIFERPFNKARPAFLNNSVTGQNLELDCYNPELKIACEYNGEQHYRFIPFFHKSKEFFTHQKYRDYMKRNLCEKEGIFLIEVPYTIQIPEIESYIKDKLLQNYKQNKVNSSRNNLDLDLDIENS